MVDSCLVVIWFWYLNGVLETRLKKACLWSQMSSIRMISQVKWHYNLNTRHPQSPVFRWILYLDVQHLDGYCSLKYHQSLLFQIHPHQLLQQFVPGLHQEGWVQVPTKFLLMSLLSGSHYLKKISDFKVNFF